MSRILVTGSAGFIGYHISRELLNLDHEVLGLDAITNYYDPKLKHSRLAILHGYEKFSQHIGRVEEMDSYFSVVEDFDPQVVIHLAAQAGVRYSIENPAEYLSSNVDGTRAIMELSRRVRPKHVLIASTSSVYGGNETLPFAETHATRSPLSLYAATKIAAESIAHSYAHIWNLPTTCFRFFTVYGPWGRPDMALFKFVKAVKSDTPIDIYGEGAMSRDFTYIADLTASIVRLIDLPPGDISRDPAPQTLSPVAPFRIVNAGGGNPVPLMQFIAEIESALGTEAKKNFLPMQPGDVTATLADTTALQALIGDLQYTPISVGVREFVEWHDGYYGS
jgi:UDP-glucuronate 4-epimerase